MEWIELEHTFLIIKNGKSIKQGKSGGYPITRIETISDRYVDEDKVGYADIYDIADYQDYLLQNGDILMSHINSPKHLGKVAIYKKDNILIHGMNLLCLRSDAEILNCFYAYYFFNSNLFLDQVFNITKYSVNQASFNITNLKKIKIPLPSLDIQEQIVELLDKAQELIDKRKEQIEALDQLIESIFYTMFGDPVKNEKGWEVKELEKVAPIKNHNIDEEIESVWLLNLDMIESNSGVLKEKTYVEIEDLPGSINCFSNKHILYSKLRPYLNKVFMPDDNGYCTSELVPLLPDCKVLNREYLLYLLRGKPALHYFNTHTSGARMPRVVMKDLKKMKISVPPLSLQNEFTNKVETIEKQKEVLGESLELMEENYKSIMDKAFKGQLFN